MLQMKLQWQKERAKSSANRLRDCVDRFLSLYQGLAHASDQRKDLLFNLVPKLHWLWHLGQKAIFLNPRKGNTMVDEDYVGIFKKIVQACAQGTPSASVSLACMDKYCWGLHFLNVYGNAYSGQWTEFLPSIKHNHIYIYIYISIYNTTTNNHRHINEAQAGESLKQKRKQRWKVKRGIFHDSVETNMSG